MHDWTCLTIKLTLGATFSSQVVISVWVEVAGQQFYDIHRTIVHCYHGSCFDVCASLFAKEMPGTSYMTLTWQAIAGVFRPFRVISDSLWFPIRRFDMIRGFQTFSLSSQMLQTSSQMTPWQTQWVGTDTNLFWLSMPSVAHSARVKLPLDGSLTAILSVLFFCYSSLAKWPWVKSSLPRPFFHRKNNKETTVRMC